MFVALAMVMQLTEKEGEVVIRKLIAEINEVEFSSEIMSV